MAMSGRSRRQSIRILQKLDRAEKYDGVHYRIKDSAIIRDFFTHHRKNMRWLRAEDERARDEQFRDQGDPGTQVMDLIRRQARSGQVKNASGIPVAIQNVVTDFVQWERSVLEKNSPDYWTIEQIEEFFDKIKPIWNFVTNIIEREKALKKNTAGQSPG